MTHIKRYTAFLLALALFAGLIYVVPREGKESYAEGAMVATPTSQFLYVNHHHAVTNYGTAKDENSIPMYTITQSNGYGANYVKLRDICYYLDMDVVWNAENPNAMYIYTNRHYLDPWESAGPATSTKTAVTSDMEIYINDEKVVPESKPVLIDNNNYFKIRDLARLLDIGCVFGPASQRYGSAVKLDSDYPYTDNEVNVDEQGVPQGRFGISTYLREKYPDSKREEKVYESSVWYGGDSGTLSDTPVTYSARDAWAREDYWNMEENREFREYWVKKNPGWSVESWGDQFNALVQLLLDRDVVESDTSGENRSNPYYKYPKTDSGSTWEYLNSIAGWTNLPALAILDVTDSNKHNYAVQLTSSVKREWSENATAYLCSGVQMYAADIIAQAKTFETDRERVTYLAHAICDRMTYSGLPEYQALYGTDKLYDQEAGNLREELAIGIWKQRDKLYDTSCIGYTLAFSMLATASGMYVRSYPYATDGSNLSHARNAVWLDDEGCWVAVDCTWADGPQSYMTSDGYDEQWICFEETTDFYWDIPSGALILAGKLKSSYNGVEHVEKKTAEDTSKTVIFTPIPQKTDSNGVITPTTPNGESVYIKEYPEGIFYAPNDEMTLMRTEDEQVQNAHVCGYAYKQLNADGSITWVPLENGTKIPSNNLIVSPVWKSNFGVLEFVD